MKGSGRGPGGKGSEDTALFPSLHTNEAPKAVANRRHVVERIISTTGVVSIGPP